MPTRNGKHILPGNGFENAIVRVQKRVLIDEWAWFAAIDRQNGRTPPPRPAVPSLLSVRQFSEKHRVWSESALRNIIFNARHAA